MVETVLITSSDIALRQCRNRKQEERTKLWLSVKEIAQYIVDVKMK